MGVHAQRTNLWSLDRLLDKLKGVVRNARLGVLSTLLSNMQRPFSSDAHYKMVKDLAPAPLPGRMIAHGGIE